MTKELTSEEIVTKLLTSNEIIKNTNKTNFYMTNPVSNLGDFLEKIVDEEIEDNKNSKYSFIKLGGWVV